MNKFFSKTQIKVIMLLNLVLVFLFAGMFFVFKKQPVIDVGAGSMPQPHSIIRAARVSANQDISWETNIGGTKDESVVSVFNSYGRIYIFGNTYSTDLDFAAGSGGFVAQLAYSGNTKSFVSFSFNIVKAISTPQGFVVIGNQGEDCVFAIINTDGVVISKIELLRQTALDLFIYNNQYFLVTQFFKHSSQVKSVMVTGLNMMLEKKFERMFTRAYSNEYITILPHKNSFVLICNTITVASPTSFASLSVFSDELLPAVHDITTNYNYTVTAALPYSGGIALMCNNASKPEILLLDKDFKLTYTKHFAQTESNAFNFFYNNGSYFSFIAPLAAPSKLYKMDSSLGGDAVVALSEDFTSITSFNANSVAGFIAGKTASGIKVLGLSNSGTNYSVSFATQAEQNVKMLTLSDGIIVIAQSNKKSADVGGNFGENDIYIAKLPFPQIYEV